MKPRTIARHFREGFKNIGRNGWMSVASIISVAITLLILGVFILLAFNVNSFAGNLENDVEVMAYVELTATAEQLAQVERQLWAIPGVAQVQFVPKDTGIEEFIESMGEQGRYFTEFVGEQNPLPDKYIVQAEDPRASASIAEQVKQVELVYKVNYGGETTDTLFAVTSVIRNVGIIFIIGLAFTAMLLIANTIKITITARRREIEIMKLVGATNSFIRWPFFIEGLLLGVIGASIPIIVLFLGYQQLLKEADKLEGYWVKLTFFELLPLYPLAYQLAFLLMGIGAFIGIWGSMLSVRKFLRV